MADEVTPPEGDQVQPTEMAALLAQMEALRISQAAIQATLAPPQEATPAPPPAPPPEPTGRISREQYNQMQAYAAQQAQRAERFQLAAQHGLQPEDLDGEFTSPQAMQQYAELLALRKSVMALERSIQDAAAEPPPPAPAGEEGEPDLPEDTGGPSGTQSPGEVATEAQYDAARALGRTVAGRQAMLQAIYGDPSKASLVRVK